MPIWGGVKGSPLTEVSDYDLDTRPLIDEQIATRASARSSSGVPRPESRSSPTSASRRVPSDRPIDGVDASAFLLGESPTTGRDHVIVSTSSRIRAEKTDLVATVMDCAWVLGPVSQRVGALMQSMAQYPNVKPGEEFTGYGELCLSERAAFRTW